MNKMKNQTDPKELALRMALLSKAIQINMTEEQRKEHEKRDKIYAKIYGDGSTTSSDTDCKNKHGKD